METMLSMGAGAEISDPVEVPDGSVVTIVLTGRGYAQVEVLGLGGKFKPDYELQGKTRNRAGRQLNGPCIIRANRPEQGNACAVGYEME